LRRGGILCRNLSIWSAASFVFNHPEDDAMNPYLTVGLSAFAAAALFEAALIPGIVIGGAALLAPKFLPRLRPAAGSIASPRIEPQASLPDQSEVERPPAVSSGLAVKQALAKTITFRIIVTGLDFTTNYVVLGELATAAGLSTVALVVGPLLYFGHETAWNYYGGSAETSADLPASSSDAEACPQGFTISRALAKTITFRTIATVVDFTTNYMVVADIATAAGLSAFGFVLGPFVYFGHERVWDYFSAPGERALDAPPPTNRVPAMLHPTAAGRRPRSVARRGYRTDSGLPSPRILRPSSG
jgi:uncharacterized membrane protein